MDFCGRILELG